MDHHIKKGEVEMGFSLRNILLTSTVLFDCKLPWLHPDLDLTNRCSSSIRTYTLDYSNLYPRLSIHLESPFDTMKKVL